MITRLPAFPERAPRLPPVRRVSPLNTSRSTDIAHPHEPLLRSAPQRSAAARSPTRPPRPPPPELGDRLVAGPATVKGKTEQALTGDVAAKVKAAALAKVSGTVERVEINVDSSAPFETHITKADGTQVEVQVNSAYTVAAVNAMPGHP